MSRWLCSLLLLGTAFAQARIPGSPCGSASAEAAIRAVLQAQVEAWNHHDLERFMAGYWNSPELTFFSGATETKGWQPTLERYQQKYQAEGRSMGTLCFSDLSSKCSATMPPLSADAFSWSCLTASSRAAYSP